MISTGFHTEGNVDNVLLQIRCDLCGKKLVFTGKVDGDEFHFKHPDKECEPDPKRLVLLDLDRHPAWKKYRELQLLAITERRAKLTEGATG